MEKKSTTGRLSTTGQEVPPRADSWYQNAPASGPVVSSGDFSGIKINIWNWAKVRRFITHSLAGGGSRNLGYLALRWKMILHGSAGDSGKMNKYAVLSVLSDKNQTKVSYASLLVAICAEEIAETNRHDICVHPPRLGSLMVLFSSGWITSGSANFSSSSKSIQRQTLACSITIFAYHDMFLDLSLGRLVSISGCYPRRAPWKITSLAASCM